MANDVQCANCGQVEQVHEQGAETQLENRELNHRRAGYKYSPKNYPRWKIPKGTPKHLRTVKAFEEWLEKKQGINLPNPPKESFGGRVILTSTLT